MAAWSGTIYGEPASKGNSRELKMLWRRDKKTKQLRNMLSVVKSEKALAYCKAVARQVPVRRPLLAGPLKAVIRVYYASERPDLDVSIILDALQDRVYRNDRQVREQHLYHSIDRDNPRAEVIIEETDVPLLTGDVMAGVEG